MRTSRTPYVIPIARAFSLPSLRRVVFVMARQMAKTHGVIFNVIGHRLDDDPCPITYIGPTQENIDNTIEPRIAELLEWAPSLWAKTAKGQQNKKHLKRVSGVSLRLGWAGSSSQLKADSAAIAFVDEVDGITADIKGSEGTPVDMAEAITSTYPDGKTGLTSTPTEGHVETCTHPDTGLEHWAESDTVVSQIWRLWQEGSRHEWAWPCPDCREYFIARFSLLKWPDGATPEQAERKAGVACPHCGTLHNDNKRAWMNERGAMVAPGQKPLPHEDGDTGVYLADYTEGDVEEKRGGQGVTFLAFGDFKMPAGVRSSATFWVSGLCTFSTKKTYGFIASKFLRAVASGEPERIKGVITTDIGELFRISGEAPKWSEVLARTGRYQSGEVPEGVRVLTAGVDVQKNRLVYVVRGWDEHYTSWLIEHGELWGETDQPEVWARLDTLINGEWSGHFISRMCVDHNYRKQPVQEFCRKHRAIAAPTMGHDHKEKPFKANNIDVNIQGRLIKNGLQLWHFDADVFKSWVHSRVQWPEDQPGAWWLPTDVDEDYCKQIVAEERMSKPSGAVVWIRRARDNHYLDCEALAYLARRIVQGVRKTSSEEQSAPQKRRVRSPGVTV